MKLDKDGVRLCDNDTCELIATHTLVWTEQMHFCIVHANQALGLANMMGFPTPANTVRTMTPDEQMPESES